PVESGCFAVQGDPGGGTHVRPAERRFLQRVQPSRQPEQRRWRRLPEYTRFRQFAPNAAIEFAADILIGGTGLPAFPRAKRAFRNLRPSAAALPRPPHLTAKSVNRPGGLFHSSPARLTDSARRGLGWRD